MPVQLVTESGFARPAMAAPRNHGAVIGPASDEGEQIALLLEVLGWQTIRAETFAGIFQSAPRLVFVDGRWDQALSGLSDSIKINGSEMVVVFGGTAHLLARLQELGEIIHFLDLPLDLAGAELLIERFT